MKKAWIAYDPSTHAIKRISWKEISGETLEIDLALAEDFMHGKEKFDDWSISVTDESICLLKKTQSPVIRTIRQFSAFQDLSSNSIESPVHIDADAITITQLGLSCTGTLYMTIKNDPSWLINSWDLPQLIENGQLKISIELASSYSYYIG